MTKEDLPSNWPNYLYTTIKHLNDHILPSLKYFSNKLLLGSIMNLWHTDSPENIEPLTVEGTDIHLAFVKQQHLDRYAATVNHTTGWKAIFDAKL